MFFFYKQKEKWNYLKIVFPFFGEIKEKQVEQLGDIHFSTF